MNNPTELFNGILEACGFEIRRTSELADELGSYEALIKYYAEAEGVVFYGDEDFDEDLEKFSQSIKADYPTIEDFAEVKPLTIMDNSYGECKGIGNYTAPEIADILDEYFTDYVSEDLVDELEDSGVRLFKSYPSLSELREIGTQLKGSKSETERQFYADHDWGFDLVELLLNGCKDVDLDAVILDKNAALAKVYAQQLDALQKIVETSDLANPSEDLESAVRLLLNLEPYYNELFDSAIVSPECLQYESILDKLTREYNGSHLEELADCTWTIARLNLAARGLFPEKLKNDEDYDVRHFAACATHKTDSDQQKSKKTNIER